MVALEAGCTLSRHPAGVARYTIELMAALAADPGEFRFEAWYPYRRLLRAGLRRRSLPARWYGNSAAAPDLMHATAAQFPAWKSPCEVATVHDLYPLGQAENRLSREQEQRKFAYIQRADWVICVSERTRQHLLEAFRYPPERSCAIPLGVNAKFRPASEPRKQELRQRLGLPADFLLFTGKARENKNLPRLIEAYAASRLDLPLYIVGSQSRYWAGRLSEEVLKHRVASRVRFLGYLHDRDLPVLMSTASAFCFPSTFEGFGLPVLEAMACGVPVLTSAGVSTEEVAGGFATLADPRSIESLADGLVRALEVDAHRLAQAAKYAQAFSWQSVAARTLEVYRKALAD